ncbi:type IV pilin protein [Pseudomonas sp. AL 58]|uniref:type IV pilin protein n=1 Tax=Pseudomonas sp. AL 58 TaxID=3104275 RepID=UPI002E99A30E|nr:type IV pilin protein [Pseudomonas sp. AL 58]
MNSSCKGLTLIELLIVIAVVGILASIAYPSYSEKVKKAARTEIAGLLFESALSLERHRSRAGQYADTDAVVTPLPTGTDYYSLHASRTAGDFVLSARRRPGTLMANDRCADFALGHDGIRRNPGVAPDHSLEHCWGN